MSSKNRNTKKKVELPENEFDPKNVKERITIFIDQDILDFFKARAKKIGSKYQTLINQALKEWQRKSSLEKRIEALEKQVKRIAS
ncbi:MAG: BrnA antitoxin family protein [Deltaproteobacteria bacterium]|nr:BrnA antitoxin family protein [Deltaproteobacteria bacterium]